MSLIFLSKKQIVSLRVPDNNKRINKNRHPNETYNLAINPCEHTPSLFFYSPFIVARKKKVHKKWLIKEDTRKMYSKNLNLIMAMDSFFENKKKS